MKRDLVIEYLGKLFVPRDNRDGVAFRTEYMNHAHEAYEVQQAVSKAQMHSGLSFDFSYSVAEKAVDVLLTVDNWNDDDALREAIDSNVPIYTGEIMEIYQANAWVVDEACEELGNTGNSSDNAMRGWYMAIERMVQAIKGNLEAIIE